MIKIIKYCYKSENLTILGLCLIFYFIFFHNIGNYPLMDVDETRYVSMARDMFLSKNFMTLFLNGNYFFEKPPLYFWQECLSFGLFGKINEFSARFPVSLLGFCFSFVVYFCAKSWINKKFALISSLILASSLEFIMLSKYAILDIVLTFYIGLAIISFFNTYFCKEKNKKYFWWLFYLFSGLAVMAKGIPGAAIPFGTVFFCCVFDKNFKNLFKPINIFPGIILFLIIVIPWHILMIKLHGQLFIDEYIIKHHLHRFFNVENDDIGRKQPFYYYFFILLWGFIPWSFSLISVIIYKLKNFFTSDNKILCIKNCRKLLSINDKNNYKKLKNLAIINFGWILLFYSLSGTKLSTYILPAYYPLAILSAKIWFDFLTKKMYKKYFVISFKIVTILSIIIGIGGIFTNYFLPQQINEFIEDAKIFSIIILLIFGILNIYLIKKDKFINIFMLYVAFMAVVSAFATEMFFETDYKFGQKDLIEFAQYAKSKNYTISANGLDRKYSLLFYNDEKVDYNHKDSNIKAIHQDLNKKNNIIIVKNKALKHLKKDLNYKIIKKGYRYTIIMQK